jgi:hypothetical protein
MSMPAKSTASSIIQIYPSLVPFVDFKVVEQNGVQTITEWNNPNPQPTQDQIDSAWFEVCKQLKKDDLSQLCNAAITGGFKSSALGIEHVYPCDDEAQRNFNTTINRFLIDPNYTSTGFKTLDAGYLSHTKSQFFQVFCDGHNGGFSYILHLNDLKAKIDKLSYPTNTEDDLNNIAW